MVSECQVAWTLVAETPWQPLSREQFRELQRGHRLRDRQGRTWTVRAAPYVEAGEYRVVLLAGDHVLVERERYADSYMSIADPTGRPRTLVRS
jgi:hypothetical protein